MSVCWGMHSPRWSYGSGHPWTGGPTGLVHGELGCMHGTSFQPAEDQAKLPDLSKPQLPPGMEGGGTVVQTNPPLYWYTPIVLKHPPTKSSTIIQLTYLRVDYNETLLNGKGSCYHIQHNLAFS